MALIQQYPHIEVLKDIAKRKKVLVHLVGGFLRDHVLGRDCDDFDFAVEKNAIKVAEVFAMKIKGAFVPLDEGHGCARVVKKQKGKIITYDFADYRAKTLLGDLSHRDFTINTLSLNIGKLTYSSTIDEYLKDCKKGLIDIQKKKIRQTSDKVFKEDPLRILRAFSLEAALGFTIEKQTLAQIKKDKGLLESVSAERIREELFKVFSAKKAAPVVKKMDRAGVLQIVIPQIKVMDKCRQGGYHHLDVWPHSVEVLNQFENMFDGGRFVCPKFNDELNSEVNDYLNETIASGHPRLALVKIGCLLHDIGKPDTRKKENNRLSFHGHEHVGKNIVKHIAKMLKISTKERHVLEDLVLWHLRPGYLSNFKRPSKKAIFRYFRDTKEEAASILLLSLADQRSTCGPLTSEADQKHHEDICLGLVEKYFDKKKEKPFVPLITGNDLIKQLKLKPSPVFGKILKKAEEQQILGKVKTKKEAIELARMIKDKSM